MLWDNDHSDHTAHFAFLAGGWPRSGHCLSLSRVWYYSINKQKSKIFKSYTINLKLKETEHDHLPGKKLSEWSLSLRIFFTQTTISSLEVFFIW